MPVCALAIAACSGDASGPSQLTLEELGQVTYGGILDEPVVLTDGRFEGEPFTRDSASRQVITLVPDAVARGDLTGDGNEEAVVLLAHNAGGSGVFMHLAVVRRQDGNPRNLATASLGDRVKVSAVEIADGRIVVDAVEHGGLQTLSCYPSGRSLNRPAAGSGGTSCGATKVAVLRPATAAGKAG